MKKSFSLKPFSKNFKLLHLYSSMNEFGKRCEVIAINYLIKNGFEIIDRNFKTKIGEIDIIARDISNNTLVFVEVKARTNNKFGIPEEALTNRKKMKIIKSSLFYLNLKELNVDSIRYDLITIYKQRNIFIINHIKNAIEVVEEYL